MSSFLEAVGWLGHTITNSGEREVYIQRELWLAGFLCVCTVYSGAPQLSSCFIRATALLKASHCSRFVSFCWCHRNSSCCSIREWQWRNLHISIWPFGSRDMKSWPLMSDCTLLSTKACVISTSQIKHSGCSPKSSFPLLDKLWFTENSTWHELRLFRKQHQF